MDEACSTHMSDKTNVQSYSQKKSGAKTTTSTYKDNERGKDVRITLI
jgi:hypothetical protein